MTALLLAVSLVASGLSFPAWVIQGGYKDFLGLSEANVQHAYALLRQKGRTWHKLKNLSSEWTRSNEQRASKTLAALILWPWLVVAAVALVR